MHQKIIIFILLFYYYSYYYYIYIVPFPLCSGVVSLKCTFRCDGLFVVDPDEGVEVFGVEGDALFITVSSFLVEGNGVSKACTRTDVAYLRKLKREMKLKIDRNVTSVKLETVLYRIVTVISN